MRLISRTAAVFGSYDQDCTVRKLGPKTKTSNVAGHEET